MLLHITEELIKVTRLLIKDQTDSMTKDGEIQIIGMGWLTVFARMRITQILPT
jgi:hypothetical protein